MSKQRTPQRSPAQSHREGASRGPFEDGHLNAALGEAFGNDLAGLSVQTGDSNQAAIGALASTQGSSMSFGPSRDPGRTDDWDTMKTVGEEVAHALAGGGSGQTWLDKPDDPGEEAAGKAGARFADFMTNGGPVPNLQPARGGRATIHRDTDPDGTAHEEEEEESAPDVDAVESSVVDRLQADQLQLIESASDRTQALAADSAADATGTLKIGGNLQPGQDAAHSIEIANGEITGGMTWMQDGEEVSSGFNFMNGDLTMGENMVNLQNPALNIGGYGLNDAGKVSTPLGSISPQLSLGIERQQFDFARNDDGTTSAMLTTRSDRTIGADVETKFVDFGFTDSDLREDSVYFDDMDGRTFDDLQDARDAVLSGEQDAEGLEDTLAAFTDGRAGDRFADTETDSNSFRLGIKPGVLGVAGEVSDQVLRENTYQNLGEGADGSHLVMISTMEYAAEGAGLELDAAVASVGGSGANADVMGYSAVVDINTPQGQSDLLLHQTLGLPPQSVQAEQLGLGENASPAEVAERVAEFAALVESGDLAENPPAWLDTSNPEWIDSLGEVPDFIAEQDADAMREAGYLSAVQGDSAAARFEATALTASLGTSEYVSSQFEHTFVDGSGSQSLIQTLSEHRWSHLFGGSGETGSRSEIEGVEAAITMQTNEDGRIEDLLENGTVENREVWDHMRGDDNDGLISDVILESDLTFDLESLAAAGLEREELDLSEISPILDPYFSQRLPGHEEDKAIYEYEAIDGYRDPLQLMHSDPDAARAQQQQIEAMGLDFDEAYQTMDANDLVQLRAMHSLGMEWGTEEGLAELDAWAAEHAPQGTSTQEFLMSTFEQTHQFVTGEANLGELDDPVAVVQMFVGEAVNRDEDTALAALPILHQLEPEQQTDALASILRAAGPDMGQNVLDWATENGIDTQATHTAVAQTERFAQIADTRERNRGDRVGDFMEEMEGLDPDMRERLIGDFAQQSTTVEGVTSRNGWAATLAMADDDQMADVFGMLEANPEQQLAVANAVLANPEEYFSDDMSEADRRAFIEQHIAPVATQGNPSLLNADDVLALAEFNDQVATAEWATTAPSEDALDATSQYQGMDPMTAQLLTGIDNGDVDLARVIDALPPGHALSADLGRFLTQNPDGSPLGPEQIRERLDAYDIEGENAQGVLQAAAATGADWNTMYAVFDEIVDDVRDPQQILDMVAWARDNTGHDLIAGAVDNTFLPTEGLTDEEIIERGAQVREHEQDRDGFGITWWSPDTDEMAELFRGVAGNDEQSRLLMEGYANAISNGDEITNILKATSGEPHMQAMAAQILMDGGFMTRAEIDAWYEDN